MPKSLEESFRDHLNTFADSLALNFGTLIAGQPEDQLKAPLQALLQRVGDLFGLQVVVRTESSVSGLGGRPDLGVAVAKLLAGHVELKAPGKGARPERFAAGDKAQWVKFQALPNLIYTDGSEWALYRTGERKGKVVRFSSDPLENGGDAIEAVEANQLLALLQDFLTWQPIVPTSPRALAELLAPLCRILRQDVLGALQDPSSAISQLAHEWRQALFPDADDPQFADAYAQTLTYALLLARLSGEDHAGTSAAADALENGHGLLAQTLRLLADPQARAELGLGIELLERSIGAIDRTALMKKHADPWLYFYEDHSFVVLAGFGS